MSKLSIYFRSDPIHLFIYTEKNGNSNIQSDVAMTPEAREEALNAIPLKRFGEADEIADAALFLATNKYANNCVLNLDGGLSAV